MSVQHDKIDALINRFKVKYIQLDALFGSKLDATKNGKRLIDTVNIFINFESLYNSLRRNDVEKIVMEADKKQLKGLYRCIMSNFINVAAHYREYFNRHKISTNIIYYYNEIVDDYSVYNNSAFISGYRDYFAETLFDIERSSVNGLIAEAVPFMELITEYIDGVYMVSTKEVESSLIPYVILMQNKFPANMNIMITKDEYDYTYVNKNFLIISKYKKEPIILTKYNLMKFLDYKYDCANKEEKFTLSSNLFPFIQAFLGDKKRSIGKIPRIGYKSVRDCLMELYEIGYIFNEDPDTMAFNNLIGILNDVNPSILKDDTMIDDLCRYHQAFDLDYQYSVLSKPQIEGIMSNLKNKYDYTALSELNNKYFDYCPLMLMELERYNPKYDTKTFKAIND